jgi:tripartite-type tricarboxylate transporter receptor subunit TctC
MSRLIVEENVPQDPLLSRRFCLAGSAALITAMAGGSQARAQSYPSQDVHVICGFAAGSGADIIVRYVAEKMRPLMGPPVVVENKPGALGSLATEIVARSRPDGHTMQIAGASSLAANMHLFKHPSVNVAETIRVAATISQATMMIVVRPDAPWKDIAELTAAMKKKGDKASWGFATPIAKAIGSMYKQLAGLQAVDVAYRTGADFMNDLTSGNIDYAAADNIQAMAQARGGKMRMLAVGASNRMRAASDIPTLKEFGYPVDIRTWWGAMVPAATPRPIVDRINAVVGEIVATDETKKFLNTFASDPWVSTPDEAQAYFLQQIKDWADYVRIAKIEPTG